MLRLPTKNNNASIDHTREYPTNHKVSWHGGVHLNNFDVREIYPIMDGVVCYAKESDDAYSEPLDYLGVTNNGCVILRHTIELTKGIEFTFYSLYMHLAGLNNNFNKDIKEKSGSSLLDGTEAKHWQDQPFPKDVMLGIAGSVDGKQGIHLQICCDQANFLKLVNRTTPKLDTTKHGREDLVYGNTHYYVPTGTTVYQHEQKTNQFISLYTTLEPYYLVVNTKTLKIIKESNEAYETVDEVKTTYLLDRLSFPIYGKENYIDLTAPNIKKYSDADFPHWNYWTVIDDDQDENSQCNSKTIKKWFDDKKLTPSQLRLLKKGAICHFPFEWNGSTFDKRFSWLKTNPPKGMKPFTNKDMQKLEDHVKALCFYDKLPDNDQQALSGRVWHFEPLAFIEQVNNIWALNLPEFIYKTQDFVPSRRIYEDTPSEMALAHAECDDLRYKDMTEEQILALVPWVQRSELFAAMVSARKSDESIWRALYADFAALSMTAGDYKVVVKEMLDRFRANIGGIYKHKLIDQACAEHKTTREAFDNIKGILSDALSVNKGMLDKTDLITIENDIKTKVKLPKFDDYDWLNGLGITIHDTWSTHIILETLEVNGNNFKAKIRFRIQDHFGLDTGDIKPLKFNQQAIFAHWFVLQRWDKYGYKPFITEFGTSKVIEGTFASSNTV